MVRSKVSASTCLVEPDSGPPFTDICLVLEQPTLCVTNAMIRRHEGQRDLERPLARGTAASSNFRRLWNVSTRSPGAMVDLQLLMGRHWCEARGVDMASRNLSFHEHRVEGSTP